MDPIYLRTSPMGAMTRENYFVVAGSQEICLNPKGSRIRINELKEKHGVTTLVATLDPKGCDYFFPYLHGNRVGEVSVENPRTGTIVLTGGMNGCAIEVHCLEEENRYIFYHDDNGKSMRSASIVPGAVQVCRITSDAYWSERNIPALASDDKHHTYPLIQFIMVYNMGVWNVGCAGILTNGSTTAVGSFDVKGNKYRGFFNHRIHLIQPR